MFTLGTELLRSHHTCERGVPPSPAAHVAAKAPTESLGSRKGETLHPVTKQLALQGGSPLLSSDYNFDFFFYCNVVFSFRQIAGPWKKSRLQDRLQMNFYLQGAGWETWGYQGKPGMGVSHEPVPALR